MVLVIRYSIVKKHPLFSSGYMWISEKNFSSMDFHWKIYVALFRLSSCDFSIIHNFYAHHDFKNCWN